MAEQQVFLVEDNALLMCFQSRMIRQLGHHVAGQAASGEEAIRGVAEAAPDMVIMDIQLAGEMSGIEAVARIRGRREIPVLYLSANTNWLTAEQRCRPDTAFLTKPTSLQQLGGAIEQLVRACPPMIT